MSWHWLRDHKRRQILEEPFPEKWRDVIARRVTHWRWLDDDERSRLEDLVQVFVAEKHWEGCGGFDMADDVQATIAAQACLLILELDHDLYRGVESILVYPSTVTAPEQPMAAAGGVVLVGGPMPILGEAAPGGPVLLVWDAVLEGARHPERGHNVVYHEFAHKLDMLGGGIDGMPPVHSREQYDRWVEVCTAEYDDLRRRAERGEKTFLDPYGGTNVGEFFAVATEYFFDKPVAMERGHAPLYEVLAGFYRQDTAGRERHHHR